MAQEAVLEEVLAFIEVVVNDMIREHGTPSTSVPRVMQWLDSTTLPGQFAGPHQDIPTNRAGVRNPPSATRPSSAAAETASGAANAWSSNIALPTQAGAAGPHRQQLRGPPQQQQQVSVDATPAPLQYVPPQVTADPASGARSHALEPETQGQSTPIAHPRPQAVQQPMGFPTVAASMPPTYATAGPTPMVPAFPYSTGAQMPYQPALPPPMYAPQMPPVGSSFMPPMHQSAWPVPSQAPWSIPPQTPWPMGHLGIPYGQPQPPMPMLPPQHMHPPQRTLPPQPMYQPQAPRPMMPIQIPTFNDILDVADLLTATTAAGTFPMPQPRTLAPPQDYLAPGHRQAGSSSNDRRTRRPSRDLTGWAQERRPDTPPGAPSWSNFSAQQARERALQYGGGNRNAAPTDHQTLPYRPGSDSMYLRGGGGPSVQLQNLTQQGAPAFPTMTDRANMPFAELARDTRPAQWGVAKIGNVSEIRERK